MDRPYKLQGVHPYLFYEDAEAALDWLSRCFGFEERVRYVDAEGRVREAEMVAGDTVIHVGGFDPGYWKTQGIKGPAGQINIVLVDDVDAHHEAASRAGVTCDPPRDQPYGARVYNAQDPEGHAWAFWQRLTGKVALGEGWTEVRAGRPRIDSP